jgi:hypothetical protein
MLKVFLISALVIVSSFSKSVSVDSIEVNKRTLQLGVYKNLYVAKRNVNKLDYKYDIYIEKINNYTIYIVNLENSIVPADVKEVFSDAFFINKNSFPKNELIVANIEERINTTKKEVLYINNDSQDKIILQDNIINEQN